MAKHLINEKAQEKAQESKAAEKLESPAEKLARLEKELKAAKEAAKAAKEAAREAAKAAKEAAKESKGKGEIQILAETIVSVCSSGIGGTKDDILKAYLKALNISPESPEALKKQATLNAQMGKRIAPRIEKLGYHIIMLRAMGQKESVYSAQPLKKESKPAEKAAQ